VWIIFLGLSDAEILDEDDVLPVFALANVATGFERSKIGANTPSPPSWGAIGHR
jgi:hypothetical protein